MVKSRKVIKKIHAEFVSDGAGVKLRRSIGLENMSYLDPFLLLDAFGSDRADDYIAGFPEHPHRGFETVTYMIAGRMRHKDSNGSEGLLLPGGVQWMTAGRGIVHSEMPEQEQGEMRGFQLWLNLPAHKKMMSPRYQNLNPESISEVNIGNNSKVRVIAGEVSNIKGAITGIFTEPIFLDIHGQTGCEFSPIIPENHACFVYVYEKFVTVAGQVTEEHELAVLDEGNRVRIEFKKRAKCILVAAKPLMEPVSRLGPFVMNTKEEINQAIKDFNSGQFLS